jgi:tetratricopeptide (TPR) repeat protein
MTLIDPNNTQAILIGASEFDFANKNFQNLLNVKSNLLRLNSLLIEVVGIDKNKSCLMLDKDNSSEITSEIIGIIPNASDTLIVYYVGHGIFRLPDFYLATKKTQPKEPEYTGAIRSKDLVDLVIKKAKAKNIIFIIDCCFSARAKEGVDSKGKQIFFITAAPSTQAAKDESPEDANYTAFTHELLVILENGIENAGEILTLQDISNQLIKQLKEKGLPEPQLSSNGQPDKLDICKNHQGAFNNTFVPEPKDKQKIDIYHLPKPSTKLVGRTQELKKITNAFNDLNTHIIGIIAAGGIGKSALVDAWLKGLKNDNGVLRVFGWSFYSQGTHGQTSSGQFFEKVLPFFGHDLKAQPIKDDLEKGRRLAELLRNQSSLLVLDGVEPLQNRAVVDGGRLKDVGLYALLRDVEKHGLAENSLVIVSSRQSLVELENSQSYQPVDLLRLNTDDGVTLLKSLQVKGLPQEFETAVEAYGGHALALVLLGNLLAKFYKGDVNQHVKLPTLLKLPKSKGKQEVRHAERVMQFYYNEHWTSDAPERCFLNLLGLFDRPMAQAEKAALIERAEIAKPLANLHEMDWQAMLSDLQEMGLLLEKKGDFFDEESYDTHPLIRSYFGEQLQTQNPSAWQQAHLVLFEYFQTVPAKEQPDTLEELEPLYRAVVHGCLAGEYKKAKEDVYRERILRGNEGYAHKLGAFAQDLTAIAAFFPECWEKPVSSGLSEANQAWLLAEASFCLMSLGRLAEAIKLRRTNLKLREKLEDWENAAITAGNLVDLLLPIGQLSKAKQAAQQAIGFADRSYYQFRQIVSRTSLATTLHRQGDLAAALKQFEAAEKIQREWQPEYSKLYSLQGAEYCALLLDLATDTTAREAVLDRGRYGLKISIDEDEKDLLSIALDYITIASALFALNRFDQASDEFDQAVSWIRKANQINLMQEFLLERAKFHRQQKDFKQSQTDLDEAQEIIDRCGMKLYAVDAALLRGHLNLDQNKTAQPEYETAKKWLEKTGYHLRDGELEELRIRLMNKT